MAPSERIVIRGAREHNLKDIDLELPRNALIVMTGLSGSGKSSLAFDTIYAEGQRRYVESLSAYARQFLGLMEKPDVDSIDGLSPAISIDQKTTSRNPRSTVGTVTEVYDYLRLLWARIGKPHCPECGEPIEGQSVEQITDRVMTLEEGTRFMVMAPVVRGRKGEFEKLFEQFRLEGYSRVRVDNEIRRLDEEIKLDKKYNHDISVVIDRLVMKGDLRRRLSESVEAAAALAGGVVEIDVLAEGSSGEAESGSAEPREGGVKGAKGAGELPRGVTDRLTFSERFACLNCGTSIPELEPRIFSFNSPHGACERCHGLGFQRVVDPDLVVPDPTLSLSEGALQPWRVGHSRYWKRLVEAVAEDYGIDPDAPWQELSDEDREIFLYGTGGERHKVNYTNRFGRRRSYSVRFEGIVNNLERRYEETDSDGVRERVEGYMAEQPCPDCKGARLRPESLAVKVGGISIHDYTELSARAALKWIKELEMNDTERAIARLLVREINERLAFLDNVGVGYLNLARSARTLSGGEAQRIRLATQIGSSLVGVLYILDEPSIGLHQRDNAKLIQTLERLRDLGNTVIVVEHDEGTMRSADHLVDLGPGAGEHGGHVISEGTPKQVEADPASLTGQYLAGQRQIEVPEKRREPRGELVVKGARQHNLKKIDVPIPLGVFCCVTGVSGSGKSTLINETLYPAVANRLHQAKLRPGAHDRIEGIGPGRQDHQHRPVADRADARDPTRRPTQTSSTTSASSMPRPARRGRAATSRGASASTSRAGAARSAGATARSRSRCTSCPTSTCRASSATASATTARRWRFASRASRSRTCSRCRSRTPAPSSRTSRRSRGGSTRFTTSGSTTSGSASRRRSCRAGRRSASSSRPSSPRSPPATRSTSSTSRPRGCTSRTFSASSTCSTGWSTRATP